MPDVYLDLKGARERLCRAQVHVKHAEERRWLQEAIDVVDRVGVLEAADRWSRFDEPTLGSDDHSSDVRD